MSKSLKKKKMVEARRPVENLEVQAPHLARQLKEFMGKLSERWLDRIENRERVGRGIDWVQSFIAWKALSRLQRAEEAQDPRVGEARELAREMHGKSNHHFFVTCIDGRNLPAIMFSFVPKLGGAMRTQAGELFSFGEELDPKTVAVNKDSFEAQAIKKLVADPERKGNTIYYSLDSHLGCAAKDGMHLSEGAEESDGGLLDDVGRKMKISHGIQEFYRELRGQKIPVADIVPQNFSYNPHDGTIYLGLEMHIDNAPREGFTQRVLSEYRKNGDVVNTWDFLEDAEVIKALEAQNIPQADFRGNFAESMLGNWQAIYALWNKGEGEVYRKIYQRIKQAYIKNGFSISDEVGSDSHLIYDGEKVVIRGAIENKAKVMLKNLVTRWSIAQANQGEGAWPFAEHQEQGVVITEGGYAPFPNPGNKPFPPDMFAVFAYDDPHNLVDHTLLSANLVRDFRRTGKIKDPLGKLEGAEFVGVPVLVLNHQILRNLGEESWGILERTNFTDLFSSLDWNFGSEIYRWGKPDIKDLLMKAVGKETFTEANDVSELIDATWELFSRTKAMLLHRDIRRLIIKGRLLIVNKLIDGYRKPRVFMPMVF